MRGGEATRRGGQSPSPSPQPSPRKRGEGEISSILRRAVVDVLEADDVVLAEINSLARRPFSGRLPRHLQVSTKKFNGQQDFFGRKTNTLPSKNFCRALGSSADCRFICGGVENGLIPYSILSVH